MLFEAPPLVGLGPPADANQTAYGLLRVALISDYLTHHVGCDAPSKDGTACKCGLEQWVAKVREKLAGLRVVPLVGSSAR